MPGFHRTTRTTVLVFLVLFVLGVSGLFGRPVEAKTKTAPSLQARHLRLCAGKAPLQSRQERERLIWLLEATGEDSLLLSASPQHKAACWMLYDDRAQSLKRSKKPFLQRYSLVVLHVSSTKSNTTLWDWPLAADEPSTLTTRGHWASPKHHECKWYGVRCNMNKIVVALDLGFLKLDGLLPRELYLLDQLSDVDFHANDFQGVLPNKMLAGWKNLEYFRLHMNGFFGTFPKEITSMTRLKHLSVFGNYLTGRIPTDLTKLSKLEYIDLYANNFAGKVPSELGKLKKLRYLDVHDNDLTGTMPASICKLKLQELVADCLGPNPEVKCDCCTICCKGRMDGTYERKCVEVKTGKQVK